MAGPWLQSFWCNGSGGGRISRVCISSQATLMLLVWNHVLRTTALGNNILHRYYMLFQRNISRICAHWKLNYTRAEYHRFIQKPRLYYTGSFTETVRKLGFHYRWKQVTIPRTALRWETIPANVDRIKQHARSRHCVGPLLTDLCLCGQEGRGQCGTERLLCSGRPLLTKVDIATSSTAPSLFSSHPRRAKSPKCD